MMEDVKGCAQRSDTKIVPQFLDQLSDARENDASRHFAISLYGKLAQVHKQAIIPYIPRMMASIVRSLPFSADSHQLHEACAKAVASLARYTIDPTRPYDSNQQILFNLCSPLLPVLDSKLESSAAGAAICLQALVESEKWKYAHPDLQHLICSKASGALSEQGVHMVTFLHLVKSLAKFSREAAHGHVTEWVRMGLRVLQEGSGLSGSRQQRVAAAQVIAVILKTADVDKLGLDLNAITEILEAHVVDRVNIVQIAVAEALETIKGIALEKRMHHDSAGSGCESKRRNSDAEDSGLQVLSSSTSPRSDTSSHEAVPSMASAKVKFGTGPMHLKNQQARDYFSLRSHASLNLSRPSKLKERTPTAIPRRVLSEIPVSGKLLSNPDVLPGSCPPKSLSRSSLDIGNKAGNALMQDKGLFGSEKSIQSIHNQILDYAKTNSPPVEKHAEGCQNLSNLGNLGCPCTLNVEEDRSNKQLASTEQLTGKADPEVFEDRAEEGMHRLSIKSACRRCDMDDDCAVDMLSNSCTNDCLLETVASKGALIERSTTLERGSHLQVEKSHALDEEDFPFRAPCSLLHSLHSSSLTDRGGESCKTGTDSDLCIPKKASQLGGDDLLPPFGESEGSHAATIEYESRGETSGASLCGVEDANSSGDQIFESVSLAQKQSLQKVDGLDGEPVSVELKNCEIRVSGYDWSSRGTSDSGFAKGGNRQNVNLHRSSKKSGRRKRFPAQRREGYNELSAGPDVKSRGTDLSGKELVLSEVLKKQICAKTSLGIICAVAILVLAVVVTQHVNRMYDSHGLVPT